MNKETKEVIIFVADVLNGFGKAYADKSFSVTDLVHFGDAAMDFPVALAGISNLPAEIAAFNDADREDLLNSFCAKFSIPQASAEKMLESVLGIAVNIWNFIK